MLHALQCVVGDPFNDQIPVPIDARFEHCACCQLKRRAAVFVPRSCRPEISGTDCRGPLVWVGVSAELDLLIAKRHACFAAGRKGHVLCLLVVGIDGAPQSKAALRDATAHQLNDIFLAQVPGICTMRIPLGAIPPRIALH